MSRFNEKHAAQETQASQKDVSRAWHDSRDSASSSGYLNERNENKVSDSEEGKGIWDAIKGFLGGKKDD